VTEGYCNGGEQLDSEELLQESLAPAFVVRAALFPLSRLRTLSDPWLAGLAQLAADESDPDHLVMDGLGYQAAYDRAMRAQQNALAAATLDDPTFMKALCIANDDLSRRLDKFHAFPDERNKRVRQIEGTLYRHLARATWRTEPCDLWAGTAIGRFGDRSSTAPTVLRIAVTPDLRPYQAIVQSLAVNDTYAGRGLYKLNPTLHRDPVHDCWRFTARAGAAVIHKQRPCNVRLDMLLNALAAMEPAPLREIRARMGGKVAPNDTSLDQMLEALVRVGLLVGGVAFPRRYATAWDALAQVPPLLVPEHARAWWSALRRLRRLCRRVERRLSEMTLIELQSTLDDVRLVSVGLAKALGIDAPRLPRSVLRCDSGLPFTVVLGSEDRARLQRAVGRYDQFERQHGVDVAARAVHRNLVESGAQTKPMGQPKGHRVPIPTQESAWRAAGADPLLGERLDRWSDWLRADVPEVTVAPNPTVRTLDLPPIGGLMVQLGTDRLRIIGITTEIGAAYGRYGLLQYGLAERARHRFEKHPLHTWHCNVLTQIACSANLEILEYVGPCEEMPNALARPDFGVRTWDRWGTATTYQQDQIVMAIESAGGSSVSVLRFPGGARSAALFCFAPVNLGYSEPTLERMLLSSFRELPFWFGPGLPLECELERDLPTPRLLLPGGDVIRARRLVVHGEALSKLAAAGRADRFLWWQALARRHRWPSVMLVACNGARPLPVVRDSPLALEAALQGLRNVVRFLCIEEPDESAWNVDGEEMAHSMEVIVPYVRRSHAWSGMAASESRHAPSR
jgi:Lantibiotic dehydratase, N terminus